MGTKDEIIDVFSLMENEKGKYSRVEQSRCCAVENGFIPIKC